VIYERLSDNAIRWGYRAADGEALTHFTNAEGHARDGLERNDRRPWLHLNLGLSLVERYRLTREPDRSLLVEAERHLDTARGLAGSQPGVEAQRLLETAAFNQCDVLIESRRIDQALAKCAQVVRDYADNPVAHYNLAAVHALLGTPDAAFAELEQDVELGDTDHGYLLGDSNFESLRDDPRFGRIVEQMKRKAEAAGD